MIYDLQFAESALKYIKTKDRSILKETSKLDAAKHIFNHARTYRSDLKFDSELSLVEYLLKDAEEKEKTIPVIERNIQYAKDEIIAKDYPVKICRDYLPENFSYNGKLFFTYGYDMGVVFGENASVNLAHGHYAGTVSELKYYSVHELHHAGFTAVKKEMPSLNITTHAEMGHLIAYFTHLEGMGVYAPLQARKNDNAMNDDPDYIALQDQALMESCEERYFEIYNSFKTSPQSRLSPNDWNCLSELSGGNRLWYRVGALMAEKINRTLGRKKLVSLISEPSENFIRQYSELSIFKENGKKLWKN